MNRDIMRLTNVSKQFQSSNRDFAALHNINLGIDKGSFLGIVGKSGSGKSTLLNMLSGIDVPSSGEIIVAGTAINQLTSGALDAWRGRHIGLVFQFFQLIPTLTVLENVLLAMDFCKIIPASERVDRSVIRPTSFLRFFPAGRNNAWPSHGRLPMIPPSSWEMNPRATWIQVRPSISSSCSNG